MSALLCPVCRAPLSDGGAVVACPHNHRFDRARQGYVNLTIGSRPRIADTPAMVAARERWLATGGYAPIARAVGALIGELGPAGGHPVLDLAGGTGYYLAAALEAAPERRGVLFDLSVPALKRAARCHPRASAFGVDLAAVLPLADASIGVALSVFGPRPVDEIERVLAPGGLLVVATPRPEHLAELREPLGMLDVDPAKDARLASTLARFELVAQREVREQLVVSRAEARDLAAMGPAGFHTDAEQLAQRSAALADSLRVSLAVRVAAYRRNGTASPT